MTLTDILAHDCEGMYECITDAHTKVIAVTTFYCGRLLNITFEHYHIDHTLSGGIRARDGWHMQPRMVKRVEKKPYMAYIRTPEQVLRYTHDDDLRNAEWTQTL